MPTYYRTVLWVEVHVQCSLAGPLSQGLIRLEIKLLAGLGWCLKVLWGRFCCKLIQVVGWLQFLEIVALRSLIAFWLSDWAIPLLLEVPSWALHEDSSSKISSNFFHTSKLSDLFSLPHFFTLVHLIDCAQMDNANVITFFLN